MSALRALQTLVPEAWQSVLSSFWNSPEATQLADFLSRIPESDVYPPRSQWFAALQGLSPEASEVVMLGQDPYHGPKQAMGLAFSVPKMQPIPPSLRNIYRELARDLGQTPPTHGDLSAWVEQGVLLLNTTLTVAPGQPGSHAGRGWEQLTQCLIQRLFEGDRPRAFLLWGAAAQRHCPAQVAPQHLVLKAPHPSPLSAHRGFLGCGHFSQVNRWRQQQGLPELDWMI